MNTTAIDYILKKLEIAADAMQFDIDGLECYRTLCQIVTDYHYDGIKPTAEQKMFVGETLENLCITLRLNYHILLDEAIAKAWGDK